MPSAPVVIECKSRNANLDRVWPRRGRPIGSGLCGIVDRVFESSIEFCSSPTTLQANAAQARIYLGITFVDMLLATK